MTHNADIQPRSSTRWTARTWGLTLLAALVITLIVSSRNYFSYRLAGRSMPFWFVVALEVPVWLTWAAFLPAIVGLARRYPLVGPHLLRNSLLHTVAGLVMAGVVIVTTTLARAQMGGDVLLPGMGFWTMIGQVYLAASLAFLFTYFAIVGLTLAWIYHRDRQEQRTRQSQLETMLARAQRDVLRMQIHPHFLFNTMHAISALMVSDVTAARRMLTRLSDLLRLSLEEDARHEVTLDEELDFLDRYLDIQRIRFGDRIRSEQHIDPATRRLLIPRLLLQPIVENSFVHGVGPREEQGSITIASRLDGDDLVVTVADDGAGPRHSVDSRADSRADGHADSRTGGRAGAGVGLGNSRLRLQQLYGPRAVLELEQRAGGGALTTIRFPAHAAPYEGGEDA